MTRLSAVNRTSCNHLHNLPFCRLLAVAKTSRMQIGAVERASSDFAAPTTNRLLVTTSESSKVETCSVDAFWLSFLPLLALKRDFILGLHRIHEWKGFCWLLVEQDFQLHGGSLLQELLQQFSFNLIIINCCIVYCFSLERSSNHFLEISGRFLKVISVRWAGEIFIKRNFRLGARFSGDKATKFGVTSRTF